MRKIMGRGDGGWGSSRRGKVNEKKKERRRKTGARSNNSGK